MGCKIPAAASEIPAKAPPAAKSRPRSPSQPSAARPVLRSRRSVSLSRQSDSAESGPRFIDVVRASLSPESGRKGTGRHSGRDQSKGTGRYSGRDQCQSKGTGKGKRSTSREERMPSVESVRRENIRPTQSSQAAERRYSGGKGTRPESSDAARRHSGGKGKGKSTNRDAGPRPSAMDSAFDRPEYGVSSAFVYCLWMIWSGFFKLSNEALTRIYESEIYDKISCELSWILRHSGWSHADQSLSVFELMAGARFSKMLSQWAHTCMSKEDPVFPVVQQKAQVQSWCEASVERINLLLPLAITIMYNQKGRYQVGILSTSDHQKGERFISKPETWIHPTGMTVEDRKELSKLYKQFRAAHVFVQAVSSHSGDAAAPITGLKIPKCQLSDMPDTLVHMTEYRHVRSIQQYGLLPGGGTGNKQRNMNHFLPIDGLLVSYEHIRPTANVALILSKATLEKHPELMGFSLSKNGYFLTKAVIPAGLFSLAWDIRNNCCVSTKMWDIPDSTPTMSVSDEPYLRFYSQLYCEVLRLVAKGHDKFKIETRRLAFKNIKIREVEAWRNEAEEKLDRHQLHGVSKLHTETWLNFLSLDDEWKDEATNMRRLKKRSLSETTEEEGEDLIDVDDDDDMDVDADIPAEDDDDDVQVINALDETMLDDLAEARQKGTWVKKGTVRKEESDMPDDPSAAASSSSAVKKEEVQSTRVWSSRARSRTPTRTVLKKADHAPGTARTPSEGRRVSFSDTPETKYIAASSKKRATSRAREVISDAKRAQKSDTKYVHRPEKMTCLVCSNSEVLFFCRACGHGSCLDCYHEVENHCPCNSIYLCSTVPDADIPAPLGEHEREEITAEIDFTIPFAAESEGWHPDDRHAGRLHRLQEIKDLVLGGGSTGYAAMDRIVLEGVSKYHYTNHPTYRSRSIPSIAQHWDEQSDVAPYPIIRPS